MLLLLIHWLFALKKLHQYSNLICRKVQMNITTYNQMGNTTNVFGYIRGEIEPGMQNCKAWITCTLTMPLCLVSCSSVHLILSPDRYVILGNHRDAWVFGAVDPTSGTAVMAEVSRVLMTLVEEGYWDIHTIFMGAMITHPKPMLINSITFSSCHKFE